MIYVFMLKSTNLSDETNIMFKKTPSRPQNCAESSLKDTFRFFVNTQLMIRDWFARP